MKKILAVAAHPADEILGCGATLAAHAQAGDRVWVLILGEGITARDANRDIQKRMNDVKELRKSCLKANEDLHVERVITIGLPDNRFDSFELLDIIKSVEQVKDEFRPQIVYTHSATDLNIDNVLTNRAVLAAFRPMPGHDLEGVLQFEVPSNTEWAFMHANRFSANYYVDISKTLPVKLGVLAERYGKEMRPSPHPRSLENIERVAQVHGAAIGVEAAEAFMVAWLLRKL